MTKTKSIKRTLLSSVFALFVCFTMLVGTTFAWFTDSVTSNNNVITTGNLDIEVEYTLDGTNWADLDGADDLFQKGLWEPGHTEVVALRIKNAGSLALKYSVNLNVIEEKIGKNKQGGDIVLSDLLTVLALTKNADAEGETILAQLFSQTSDDSTFTALSLKEGVNFSAEDLLPNESDYLFIKIDMPEIIGNDANHDGVNVPSIEFGIEVIATQMAHEYDSFDNTYDEDLVFTGSYQDLVDLKGSDGSYFLTSDIEASDVLLFGDGTDVSLDLNGKEVEITTAGKFAFGAQYGGTLHITGDGVVNSPNGFMANREGAEIVVDSGTFNTKQGRTVGGMPVASVAQNNARIVINGGTFTTSVDNAALFYVANSSTVEINGGFFENTVDKTPDLLHMGTNKYQTNRIIIKGGTFVNYNPLDDHMAYTGAWPNSYEQFSGPWILVWDGYKVVSETQPNGDVWYTVVPE